MTGGGRAWSWDLGRWGVESRNEARFTFTTKQVIQWES